MVKDQKRALTTADMRDLKSIFAIKDELRDLDTRMTSMQDRIFTLLDSIVTEIQEMRHENMAFLRRMERNDKKLEDHDKQITNLEKAAPA